MLPETQLLFTKLTRLSDITMGNALLKDLDQKITLDPLNASLWIARETICRRLGDLQEACDAKQMIRHRDLTSPLKGEMKSVSVLKPRPQKHTPEYTTAPLYIVDDFLCSDTVAELLEYTNAQQNEYRPANINYEAPEYSPEKRNTLVLHKKNKFQHYFLNYIQQNFAPLCNQLGIPKFNMSKIEIKLTNHINTGFFQTHSDNHDQFNKPGRAISWLYYYHTQPKEFTGGDLYLFDSNIKTKFYDEGNFTKVIPIHNRFVAFPSWYYHTVSPVNLSSNKFLDGRHACAGHVRFG